MTIKSYNNIILLTILAICIYILNIYYPFIHDDYAYHYIYGNNSNIIRPTSTPISSISDILYSLCNHYKYVNGRFSSPFIMQLFAGLTGKPLFNIINTIILIFHCILFTKIAIGKLNIISILIPFSLILFNIPFPGQTIFWLTGAINYLWPTTFSLFILYYINKSPARINTLIGIFFIIFSFFTGWMNESVSIPVAGGMFIYYLTKYKQLTIYQKAIIISYCIGCALIIFAPGTTSRLETGNEIQISSNIITFLFTRFWNYILYTIKYPISIIIVIFTTITFISKEERAINFIKKESLYIYTFCFATLFLWLLNMNEERIYFFYVILSWLLFIKYIIFIYYIKFQSNNKTSISKIIPYALFLITIIGFISAFKNIKEYHDYNKTIINMIESSSPYCFIKQINYPQKNNKYIYVTELSDDPSNYHNRVKSFFYQKEQIAAWPEKVYNSVLNYKRLSFRNFNQKFKMTNIENQYLVFIASEAITNKIKIITEKTNPEYNTLTKKQIIIRKLLGSDTNNQKIVQEEYKTPIIYDQKSFIYIPYDTYNSIKLEIQKTISK